jgi:hypothetical protein
MRVFAAVSSLALIVLVLVDAFESIILPRRVTRRFRFARAFYFTSWTVWAFVGQRILDRKRRETYLSVFGPLSLIWLLGLWAACMVLAFGLLQWACGSTLGISGEPPSLFADIYFSGTTFFTLGYGDLVPKTPLTRIVAITESGMGFGFLAIVIGYLPVIYAAFSRREGTITLLDSRAGSPSSAVELVRRYAKRGSLSALDGFFSEWEKWSAELLESHLSYPVLSYYRSQHDNQSWLASITTVLDACSLVVAGIVDLPSWQASLTFAIARHAMVDLAQIYQATPIPPAGSRLTENSLAEAREMLRNAGTPVRWCDNSASRLQELRDLYEPYVTALSRRFLLPLPAWLPAPRQVSNWQTSAWGRASGRVAMEGEDAVEDVH